MRLLLLLSVILISGCSLSIEPDIEEDGTLLFTDRAAYDASVSFWRPRAVTVQIPFEIRNSTGGDLYLIGCGTPSPPALEKWVGEEWVTAYSAVVNLCLSPPWTVASGDVRRDTLHVWGALPGQNAGPTFDTEVRGTYRLRQTIYTSLTDESSPLGRGPLSDSLSVSNTFTLR